MYIVPPGQAFSPVQPLASTVGRADIQAAESNGVKKSLVLMQLSTTYGDLSFCFDVEHARELAGKIMATDGNIDQNPTNLIVPDLQLPPDFNPKGP